MILEERNEESRKHFYVPFRCDKKVDCHDKSDEQNCNYRQQHDEVKRNANEEKNTHHANQDHECKVDGRKDGLFIPKEKKCDGYYDCRDKSDEEGCKGMSCEVRDKLLLMSEVVLLVSACADQDMMWLQNIYPDLQLSEFRCKNGEKCIQQYQKCNHRSKPLPIPPKLLNPALSVVNITKNLCRAECSDGSDEEDCSKCPSSFQTCISWFLQSNKK